MRRLWAIVAGVLIAAAAGSALYYGWHMKQSTEVRGGPAGAAVMPAGGATNLGPDVVLGPGSRAVPGARPVALLAYRNPDAREAFVAGSWSKWSTKHPMERRGSQWVLDVRAFHLSPGRYEFKFLPDGAWEDGDNRMLHINEAGLLERPPDAILAVLQEEPDRVDIHFKSAIADPDRVRVRLAPERPIASVAWSTEHGNRHLCGYAVSGNQLTFCLDEKMYGVALAPSDTVCVAGTFNGWDARGSLWRLADPEDDGVWEGSFALDAALPGSGGVGQFKFVVNGDRWLEPPGKAPNLTTLDGHTNLALVPTASAAPTLRLRTRDPLPLSEPFAVVVEGVAGRPARFEVSPGAVLDRFRSDKPLGAILDRAGNRTVFRLFAPRASRVDLCFFAKPDPASPPVETVALQRDARDGVWEAAVPGLRAGRFYGFRVDGPAGPGEGFDFSRPVGDPYARAVAHSDGLSILVDPDARTEWFSGWTDAGFRPPAREDAVIYEAHLRDLTIDPSSGVTPLLRGKYPGLAAGGAANPALAHLRALGVNMLELLPVSEFANGLRDYGWGYSPAYYFAPESSYATAPLLGSAYYEFQALVNELHRQGFGVILDVVYNHVGAPNVFYALDRKYYFRQSADQAMSNVSGCGNDLRTEAPMLRRLIVENVLYWMREHHVDGFRFDLCEIIDMATLRELEREARQANPNVLLISEPWSARGDHKRALRGTGWAAWNDEFREAAKRFAAGTAERDALQRAIAGSTESWAANPLQSVNYVESHDDYCLCDYLAEAPAHDGRQAGDEEAARNRLAATILFTSLGMPMLAEGQEFLRSKQGIANAYNRGDEVNALRWTDRERPAAAETLAYYRGLLRLRLSDAGRPFRLREAAPAGHFAWILPALRGALGYVVNGRRDTPGAAFVVLLNSARRAVRFEVAFPDGRWRLIGDGRQLAPDGLPDPGLADGGPGTRSVMVPALSSRIYMSL